MNPIESAINNARVLARNGDFSDALNTLDNIGNHPYLPSKYYLLKGRLIQSSDGVRYSLEDSRRALETALELEPDNAEVLSELGFLYSRVIPDQTKAIKHFQKGVDRLRSLYAEAICGLIEVTSDKPAEFYKIVEEELAKLNKNLKDRLLT